MKNSTSYLKVASYEAKAGEVKKYYSSIQEALTHQSCLSGYRMNIKRR